MRTFKPGKPRLAAGRLRAHRARPRSYEEWKALRRWGQLPDWESSPAGYLLRLAREETNLSQAGLAKRLGCSQQAVAQAERWMSNPTLAFVRRWQEACGVHRPMESYVAELGDYRLSGAPESIRLDPDLAIRFKTSTAVNRALRAFVSEHAARRRSTKRLKARAPSKERERS